MLSGLKRLNILYIPLEFRDYFCMSRWAYPANFGLEEGFEAAGVDLTTVPAYYNPSGVVHEPGGWLCHAQELLNGRTFDQIWIEIAQSRYSPYFLDWLCSLAPVRVGLIFESFEPDTKEYISNPRVLAMRSKNIAQNVSYMTHLVVSDETDFDRLREEGKKPAFWWNCGKIPRRCIAPKHESPNNEPGLFYGTVYDVRRKFFETPLLRKLLLHKTKSLEHFTGFPRFYEQVQESTCFELKQKKTANTEQLHHYLAQHRFLRRRLFDIWLQSLKPGCAVVNLPQHGRVYAGRFTEGMAVGKPVISWRIPNSPKAGLMFEEDKEILLFDKSKPSQLAAHIQALQKDHDLAVRIGEAGRKKLLEEHTIEAFVQQALYWIRTGEDKNAGPLIERRAALGSLVEEVEHDSKKKKRRRVRSRNSIAVMKRLRRIIPTDTYECASRLLQLMEVPDLLNDEEREEFSDSIGVAENISGSTTSGSALSDIKKLQSLKGICVESFLWDACAASGISIGEVNFETIWRNVLGCQTIEQLVWSIKQQQIKESKDKPVPDAGSSTNGQPETKLVIEAQRSPSLPVDPKVSLLSRRGSAALPLRSDKGAPQ